jgi:CBS domain-containing protein
MRLGECCNRTVVIADRDMSIPDAARLMREYHVGDLIVVQREKEFNRPIGIITDRDLVVEVLAQNAQPSELTINDVMSEDLASASEDDDVLDTLRRMRSLGIRRMPVVNRSGALVGIMAVDDLLELIRGSLNDVIGLIAREIGRETKQRP